MLAVTRMSCFVNFVQGEGDICRSGIFLILLSHKGRALMGLIRTCERGSTQTPEHFRHLRTQPKHVAISKKVGSDQTDSMGVLIVNFPVSRRIKFSLSPNMKPHKGKVIIGRR